MTTTKPYRDHLLKEKKFDKAAVISKLSLCACGGTADDHAKDELENLLKCSHCDTCEAFHYDVDAQEQQAA